MKTLQMIAKTVLKTILFIALAIILYSIFAFSVGFIITMLIKHWEGIATVLIMSFLIWLNNTESGEKWSNSNWR